MSWTIVRVHLPLASLPEPIPYAASSLLARKVRNHIVLQAFYIEALLELANFGEIEDMVVCDNFCDHLIGNVYVKYYVKDVSDASGRQRSAS